MSGPTVTDYMRDPDRSAVIDFTATHIAGSRGAAHDHFADHDNGDGTTLVARSDGRIVGLVTIRWRSGNPDLARSDIPLVHQLTVDPEHRRDGIASGLMDAAETLALARGHSSMATTVGLPAEYGPAQRLYTTRGYRPDGRGACRGLTPVRLGDQVRLDHDLIIWLIKDLGIS